MFESLEDRIVPDGPGDSGGSVPSVSVIAVSNALQGVSDGQFQFQLSQSVGSDISVSYSTSGTALSGADYSPLTGTITIPAGSTTALLDVAATSNPIDGNESVTVGASSGTNYSLGTTNSATIQIINLSAGTETIGTLANTAVATQPPATEFGVADNAVTTTAVTQGADGSVTLNSDGTVTYTPNSGFIGSDSFAYTVEDSFGNTATGTIAVDVSPVVTAMSDTMLASENTATSFPVLDLASDANSAALSTESVTQGSNGSVSINSDGTVTYTPNTGFIGTDSFTYTAEDAAGNAATGTITVTVSAGPFSLGGSASTVLNTAVDVPVLSDAFSPTGETLSVSSVTQGADGSASINSDGSVAYTPNTGFIGTDSFTYTVEDTDGNTATQTITVTVSPVISTTPDNASAVENAATTIPVLDQAADANGATLTVTSVTQGSIGSVTLNSDGTVTYTPTTNRIGSDSFAYTVEDTAGNTATGTVNVAVVPGIIAPEIVASTIENTAALVPTTSQATDAQGETLTVSAVTQGAHGSVTINSGGTVTYTPNMGFSGTDTFAYTVEDTSGTTTSNYVTVTVSGSTLEAGNGTVSTANDSAVTVTVMNYVTYSPGSTVAVTSVTQGANGTVALNSDGTVTYTPSTGFFGTDTFGYTVENNSGTYATGTITVQVGSFDVVVTWGAFVTTAPDTADTVNLLSDSADFPGNTLTLESVTQGAHGSVTMSGGAVTYTPAAGYCGPDTFTYTVEDELGNTATATVTEFISAVVGQQNSSKLDASTLRYLCWSAQASIESSAGSGQIASTGITYLVGLLVAAEKGKGPIAGNVALQSAAIDLANVLKSIYTTTEGQYNFAIWLRANALASLKSMGAEIPASIQDYMIPPFPPRTW